MPTPRPRPTATPTAVRATTALPTRRVRRIRARHQTLLRIFEKKCSVEFFPMNHIEICCLFLQLKGVPRRAGPGRIQARPATRERRRASRGADRMRRRLRMRFWLRDAFVLATRISTDHNFFWKFFCQHSIEREQCVPEGVGPPVFLGPSGLWAASAKRPDRLKHSRNSSWPVPLYLTAVFLAFSRQMDTDALEAAASLTTLAAVGGSAQQQQQQQQRTNNKKRKPALFLNVHGAPTNPSIDPAPDRAHGGLGQHHHQQRLHGHHQRDDDMMIADDDSGSASGSGSASTGGGGSSGGSSGTVQGGGANSDESDELMVVDDSHGTIR